MQVYKIIYNLFVKTLLVILFIGFSVFGGFYFFNENQSTNSEYINDEESRRIEIIELAQGTSNTVNIELATDKIDFSFENDIKAEPKPNKGYIDIYLNSEMYRRIRSMEANISNFKKGTNKVEILFRYNDGTEIKELNEKVDRVAYFEAK